MTDIITASDQEKAWLSNIVEQGTDGLCPDCLGREFIMQEDGTAVSCRCKKDRMLESYYEAAGIPRAYYHMTLESDWNLKQDVAGENLIESRMIRKTQVGALVAKYKKALPAICAGVPFVLNKKYELQPIKVDSLRLIGGEDSGKTLLAAIIAMTAVRSGLSTKFWDWTALCDALAPYPRDAELQETQSQIKSDFGTKMVIVVDDITEYGGGGPNLLFNLDYIAKIRMNNKLPTIFTHRTDYTNTKFHHNWHSIVNKACEIRLQ